MSAFREAVRDMLMRDLVCPGCQEANSTTHRQIELNEDNTRAYCKTCSREGPLGVFLPRPRRADRDVT